MALSLRSNGSRGDQFAWNGDRLAVESVCKVNGIPSWLPRANYARTAVPGHARRRREILHLTAMGSTKYGGLEQYFVELARQCRARGYRLILQYDEWPHSKRYRDDLCSAGGALLIQPLGAGRVSAAVRAIALVARYRPRIVHFHFCDNWTRLAVGLLAHWLGVDRTLATVHLMPALGSRTLMRVSYACIDRVLAVSHAVERALSEIGVPHGVLATHYLGIPELGHLPPEARRCVRSELSIPPTAPALVTLAFTSRLKGVDVLIDAFVDHLMERHPDLHLIIVGIPQSGCGLVSSRAERLSERIHWAGIQDDVKPYLRAADVYVQPSRTEGLPLAVLEAMRQSLPVVATAVGGTPELVGDDVTGLLVQPESPQELAAAISRLLDDPGLALRLAQAGHGRWRQDFQVATSVKSLLDEHCGLPLGSCSRTT